MKSFFRIILFLVAINACTPEPEITSERTSVNQVSTIVKQGTSSPEPQKTPTPEPTATVINVKAHFEKEITEFTAQCLKNAALPEQIHFPTDLTVSKDGQTLFMLASYCEQLPDKPNLTSGNSICVDKEESVPHDEKFVYQLKAENNFLPQPILENNSPVLGCRVKEIEATEDGKTLFLSDFIDYRIHAYDEKLSTIVEGYGVSPHGFLGLYSPDIDRPLYWGRPQYLKIEGNHLLYRQIVHAGMGTYYHTRELNVATKKLKDRYCNLNGSGQGFKIAILSFFHKDHVYFFDVTESQRRASSIYLERSPARQDTCYVNTSPTTYFIESPNADGGYHLAGMVIDSKGTIYVSETLSNTIYTINLPPYEENDRGDFLEKYTSGKTGYQDGDLSEAQFNTPTTLVIDAQDNIYVADTSNHAIRKITPEGVVSTLFKQEIPFK